MSFTRRTRYVYWIVRDLARRYTRSLLVGFSGGLLLSVLFWQIWPWFFASFLVPVERIGLVGEFAPDTLPLTIQKSLSRGLTGVSEDGQALPALADWWEATDSGKRYLFHIRDDAVWHDGKKAVAADINYNIKDVVFRVITPEIIEAELQYPYSPFPLVLSKPLFKSGLIGLGEYRIGRVVFNGNTIRLIRLIPAKDNSKLPVKEYRFYKTENLAVLAYKLGEIDVISDIANPNELTAWGKNRIIERVRYDRIVALFFNMKNEMLSQKDLRRGLAYAVPQLDNEPAFSPISKMSWAYTDKVKTFDFDEKTAKDLLEDVQLASASPVLTITTFSQYLDDAQAIADSWTKAGVDTGVRVENNVPEDYQVLLSAIELPPDPDQYAFWHSTQNQTNITGYVNVKIDKLLEDGRQETDPDKRKKIYEDFERRLVDDVPAIFLYYPKTYTVKRK